MALESALPWLYQYRIATTVGLVGISFTTFVCKTNSISLDAESFGADLSSSPECLRRGYEFGGSSRSALSDAGDSDEGFSGFRVRQAGNQRIIHLDFPFRRTDRTP